MNKIVKIIVTDDEVLFRRGLAHILSEHENFEVICQAENGTDLLTKLNTVAEQPQIILLDMEMPVMDGVDTLKALQKAFPAIKVIILTSHYNATVILKMIELGASAFMPKNIHPDELIATIENVYNKGFHYNDFTIQLLRERMQLGKTKQKEIIEDLTKREKEILKLICDQYTNKEIAERLFISPRTVDGHRNKMLEKTNSKNTVGLIFYAIENQIISLSLSKILLQ